MRQRHSGRLFHHDGERAIAKVAEKLGTMFCVSTIGTRSIEELGAMTKAAKLFQLYIHKDHGLTNDLIARCKAANFSAMALTVDTIVSGNRERDYHTGMTTPPKFTLKSLASFATRVMTHGTQRYPFQDFYELIESNGASLDIGSGRHLGDR